jgi:hypothetical protein
MSIPQGLTVPANDAGLPEELDCFYLFGVRINQACLLHDHTQRLGTIMPSDAARVRQALVMVQEACDRFGRSVGWGPSETLARREVERAVTDWDAQADAADAWMDLAVVAQPMQQLRVQARAIARRRPAGAREAADWFELGLEVVDLYEKLEEGLVGLAAWEWHHRDRLDALLSAVGSSLDRLLPEVVEERPRDAYYELPEVFSAWHWIEEGLDRLGASSAGRPSAAARHSPDFRSVIWYGTPYTFTGNQAACVKVLWEAWEAGTAHLAQETVLEQAAVESGRLIDVFKDHPAWGRMVARGPRKGLYSLQPPAPAGGAKTSPGKATAGR